MIGITRSSQSLFALKRSYRFEFSTVGDIRYSGIIILKGLQVSHIELEPHKVKQADD